MLYRPASSKKMGFFSFLFVRRTANNFQIAHKKWIHFGLVLTLLLIQAMSVTNMKLFFPNNGMSQSFIKYCIHDPFRSHFFGSFCVSFLSTSQIPYEHIHTTHIHLSLLTIVTEKKTKFIKTKFCLSCRMPNVYVKKKTPRKNEKNKCTYCASAIIWNWNPDERIMKNVSEVQWNHIKSIKWT